MLGVGLVVEVHAQPLIRGHGGHNESFVSAARGVDASRRLLRCQETSVLQIVLPGRVSCYTD